MNENFSDVLEWIHEYTVFKRKLPGLEEIVNQFSISISQAKAVRDYYSKQKGKS